MNLSTLLTAVSRRVLWRHMLPWLLRSLAAGLLTGAVVFGGSRLLQLDAGTAMAVIVSIVVATIVAVAGWVQRPGPAASLRRADYALNLQNRLSTAWEYRDSEAPLASLQRDDLLSIDRRENLAGKLPIRLSRRDSVLPAAGALLLFGALLVPHAQPRSSATDGTAASRLRHAVARVSATQKSTTNVAKQTSGALSAADRRRQSQIAKILAQLKRDLAAAHTPAQALKAIARAQDALNKLSNPQINQQRTALQNLSKALSSTPATNGLANAIKQGKPADVQKAASALARQLNHMSAAQRAKLARTLQAAANAASADSKLANSLQNAATSLAQGDTATAKTALGQSGQQAARDVAQSQQQSNLDQANSMLDNARNDITSQASNSSQASSQKSGTGSGSKASSASGQGSKGKPANAGGNGGQAAGKGTGSKGSSGAAGQGGGSKGARGGSGQGSANGSGRGNGSSGSGSGTGRNSGSSSSGNGSGQGNGSGSGNGQGSGQGGGGSRGGNSSRGNQGGTQGDRVYVGGQQGQGPSSSQQGTPNAPSSGHVSSWRSVLPSYERGARDAVDSGSVPPSDQGLVKNYFNELDRLNH